MLSIIQLLGCVVCNIFGKLNKEMNALSMGIKDDGVVVTKPGKMFHTIYVCLYFESEACLFYETCVV